MYQFVVPMSGLNCMGCARKIEKALHANHSVEIINLSPTMVEVKTESLFLLLLNPLSHWVIRPGINISST